MKNEKQYNTKQKETLLGLFKGNPGRCFTSKEIIASRDVNCSYNVNPILY